MELRQLAYFVAVVEEANFTRAAARLHVAQPGVSAQIRQLERELGHELLDRGGRAVRVTEMGAAVLPYARAALAAVEGARLVVDELAGLVRGHVALGMITSHTFDIPGLLAGFHDDYPAVEITLAEGNSDRLVEEVLGGRMDAAIIGIAGEPPAGLGVHVLVDQAIVAAVNQRDPLARRTKISVETLRDRALICLPQGTGCVPAWKPPAPRPVSSRTWPSRPGHRRCWPNSPSAGWAPPSCPSRSSICAPACTGSPCRGSGGGSRSCGGGRAEQPGGTRPGRPGASGLARGGLVRAYFVGRHNKSGSSRTPEPGA
ncbi:hypothetical protein GCM10029964_040690 [Kibdelosporangium lantanae]